MWRCAFFFGVTWGVMSLSSCRSWSLPLNTSVGFMSRSPITAVEMFSFFCLFSFFRKELKGQRQAAWHRGQNAETHLSLAGEPSRSFSIFSLPFIANPLISEDSPQLGACLSKATVTIMCSVWCCNRFSASVSLLFLDCWVCVKWILTCMSRPQPRREGDKVVAYVVQKDNVRWWIPQGWLLTAEQPWLPR